jgi:phenylacetate-CoA oxygenase PaaH subunit
MGKKHDKNPRRPSGLSPEQLEKQARDHMGAARFRHARDTYTRRLEGVSLWVIRSTDIVASDPEQAGELFEPAEDKIYRHPTFYEIPDVVKHI